MCIYWETTLHQVLFCHQGAAGAGILGGGLGAQSEGVLWGLGLREATVWLGWATCIGRRGQRPSHGPGSPPTTSQPRFTVSLKDEEGPHTMGPWGSIPRTGITWARAPPQPGNQQVPSYQTEEASYAGGGGGQFLGPLSS